MVMTTVDIYITDNNCYINYLGAMNNNILMIWSNVPQHGSYSTIVVL